VFKLKKTLTIKNQQNNIIMTNSLAKSRDNKLFTLKIKLQKDVNNKNINKNSQSNTLPI
jgi:hypothetical protein